MRIRSPVAAKPSCVPGTDLRTTRRLLLLRQVNEKADSKDVAWQKPWIQISRVISWDEYLMLSEVSWVMGVPPVFHCGNLPNKNHVKPSSELLDTPMTVGPPHFLGMISVSCIPLESWHDGRLTSVLQVPSMEEFDTLRDRRWGRWLADINSLNWRSFTMKKKKHVTYVCYLSLFVMVVLLNWWKMFARTLYIYQHQPNNGPACQGRTW